MIVVSDTSPLNYLLLIDHIDVLPKLFGRVIVPSAVMLELGRDAAPDKVRQWSAALPHWLEVATPTSVIEDARLGPAESEAIALARELHASLLLADDRLGVAAARQMGLAVTGTLGVLDFAAEKRLLDLGSAISALSQTTFRDPKDLIDQLLKRDANRTPKPE